MAPAARADTGLGTGTGTLPDVLINTVTEWSPTHQQAYLAHGPRTIPDPYRQHEIVAEHLERDGERLVEFIMRAIAIKTGGVSGGIENTVPQKV